MRWTWRKLLVCVCLASGISVEAAKAQDKIPAKLGSPTVVMVEPSAPLSDWYAQSGTVILHRNVASSAVLITDPAGKPITTAQDFHFNFGGGPQLLLGKMIDEDTAVEINYFGVYRMRSSLTQAGPGIPVGGTAVRTNFFADYRSNMTNVELNLRHWMSCELSIIAGFRYVNWHDELDGGFTIPGVAAVPPGGVIAPIPGVPAIPAKPAFFNGLTNNNLYGAQVGADWQRTAGRFGVEAYSKLGLFGNEAYGRGSFTDGDGVTTSGSSVRCQLAFLGEIGLMGSFKITNSCTLRVGYTGIWIEGIAIIPGQASAFGGGGGGTLNSQNGVFLHGVFLTTDIRW